MIYKMIFLLTTLAIFVFISGCIQQQTQTTTTTQPQTTATTAIQQGPEIPSELTSEGDLSESINELDQLQATSFEVLITSSGFSPSTLTIKVGDTVTFINKDSRPHWPASDVHPTHRLYPGSGIEKCGSGEEIFDACKGLAPGETFSFTFKYRGTWTYHDHLYPYLTGTIIVQ
jgi:plastocyanin